MDRSDEVTSEVEMHRDLSTATFEWRVPDFSQVQRGDNCSPTVTHFNMDWCLGIHKDGNGTDCVFLHRELLTPSVTESVHFTIKCKTAEGEERDIAREQTFPENRQSWDLYIDRPWRIPSLAGVTLICSLWKDDSPHAPRVSRETQTEDAQGQNDEHPLEDISILREHYKQLLLSEDGHDVLIKVKERQFKAHKHILKARSPVLRAMFSNEMAESAEDSVTIKDCDPDAFGEFLQFVYSGKADIASVGRALGLYYAGDKYDFPRLKETCVQFLKNSFSTTTVFDVIHLAARHNEEELLRQAIVYFAEHLEETMLTVEWQRFILAYPIEGNEMNLKALQFLKTSLNKK